MVRLRNMNENTARNFNMVEVGNLDLYFSYETVVAFRSPKTGLVISENVWSSTTGKHLNWINPDKDRRVKHEEFEKLLKETLEGAGL